jgi:hypothetical protein
VTRRERHVLARLLDEVAAPGGVLPPVEQTDAVQAFDGWLNAGPRLNRTLLRAALLARPQLLTRVALHCYYGDAEVSRRLGYDPAAALRRAAALRSAA